MLKKRPILIYALTAALIIQVFPLQVLGSETDTSLTGSELEALFEDIDEEHPTEDLDIDEETVTDVKEMEEDIESYIALPEEELLAEELIEMMAASTGDESTAPAPTVYIGNGYQEYSWTKWSGAPSVAGDQTGKMMIEFGSSLLDTGDTMLIRTVVFKWRNNMSRVGLTVYYVDNPNSTSHYLVPLQYGGSGTDDMGNIFFNLQAVNPGYYCVEPWYEVTNGTRYSTSPFYVQVFTNGPATITPSYVELEIGQTQKFTNDIFKGLTGPRGEDYNVSLVTWSNSDNSVMNFVNSGASATGTALKAGTTYVTAQSKCGKYSAMCQVVVKAPEVLPTGVAISPSTPQTLDVGATLQLSKTITPTGATNTAVTWTSSNTGVATITSAGLVRAVSPGTTTITVKTHNNKSATLSITVKDPIVNPESVTITPSAPQTLSIGETTQLTGQVLPANTTDAVLTWASSDENILTISGSGNTRTITAVGAGSATITAATHNNKTASVSFTVPEQPITEVKVQPAALTLEINDTYEMQALFTPANPTNQSLTWASSDLSVVTVSGNGPKADITAVGTGSAIVTAMSHNNKIGFATITVVPGAVAVEGFRLDPASTSVPVGSAIEVLPVFTPVNASNTNYSIMVSDPSKIEVNKKSDGVLEIKGLATGYSAIIATTEDGNFTAFSNITVTEGALVIPVESIRLNKTQLNLNEGQTERLQVTFNPDGATDRRLEWTTSDPAKAAVDQDGNVTAVSEGNAIIFVKSVDGNHTDICTVTITGASTPQPSGNLALGAVASSNSYVNNNLSPDKVNDGDYDTRWMAVATDANVYLELDFGAIITFNEIKIKELNSRIAAYSLEYWNGSSWVIFDSGATIGPNFAKSYASCSTSKIRLVMTANSTANGYSIYEFEVFNN